MSNSFIKKVQAISLLGGHFIGEIEFKNGLNIIGGENGTGKTKLLEYIKTGTKVFDGAPTTKIAHFNPKRNAEKNTISHFVQKLRREGTSQEKIAATLLSQNVGDSSFAGYPSIIELFITGYEHVVDGDENKGKKTAINEIVLEFNRVLTKIFPTHSFVADWIDRNLVFKLHKEGCPPCPIENLSCGENEVFSLIFSIYNSRNSVDIFLIDEPEIHLNWALELGLFKFLDWMCSEHHKQVLVTTHSRVIFLKEFFSKTQFLVWEDSKVIIKDTPPEASRKSLIAESIDFVTGLDIHEKTFFVEDVSHEIVISKLINKLSKDVGVIQLGDRSHVEGFCKATKQDPQKRVLFLVDGDNQNSSQDLQEDSRFIHLNKYSIENYLLDFKVLAGMLNSDENAARQLICDKIRDVQQGADNLVYKRLIASDPLQLTEEVLSTFKAKTIISAVQSGLGQTDLKSFVDLYIDKASELGVLESIFSEIIVKINEL